MQSDSESSSSACSDPDDQSSQSNTTSTTCTASSNDTTESEAAELTSSSDSRPSSSSSSDMLLGDPPSSERVKAEPLYDGAEVSTLMTYLLLFQYAIRNGLSKKAFTELIELVRVLLPRAAKLPRSVHELKKFISDLFPDMQANTNAYCSFCHQFLPSPLAVCRVCAGSRTQRFITVPLQPQLRRMLEDPGMWKLLQERFHREIEPRTFRDIYDGKEYQKHQEFLSRPANISLTANTDRVALFRSSTTSLWPVWLAVNELPRNLRFVKKNMLLAAMWFSKEKPPMSLFLKPFMDALNDIYTNGIQVKTPAGIMTARAILLLLTVDLPARALVLNMKQFNGAHACCYCEFSGETKEGNALVRYWPPTRQVLRTHRSFMDNARVATTHGKVEKGVKGASILCIHPPFNLVKGIAIDSLHAIFIGVVHQLLKLWLDKANRQEDFFIGNKSETLLNCDNCECVGCLEDQLIPGTVYLIRAKVDLCNKRMCMIKVPDVISRIPKSLSDLAHWKASEHRSWILFYALPVLYGVLGEPYYSHLALLVAALHVLWADRITEAELTRARSYLNRFYTNCPQLYGIRCCTMNVHLLSHLASCVEDWGPLWAYSCFPFESMNRELKHLFHGTCDMSAQMAFSYVITQALHAMVQPSLPPRIQAFSNLMNGKKRIKQQQLQRSGAIIVGGVKMATISTHILELLKCLAASCGHPTELDVDGGSKFQKFYRLQLGTELYYSQEYGRVKKRNSFTVMYRDGGELQCGQVQYFLHGFELVAVVKILKPCVGSFADPCSFEFGIPIISVKCDNFAAILVTNILYKCVFIDLELTKYIALFPSNIVGD